MLFHKRSYASIKITMIACNNNNTNITVARPGAIYLLLFFVAATFAPALTLFFSAPDDSWMLLKNAKAAPESFNFQFFISLFDTADEIQYAPLNYFYYFLIYKINGYDPYYYHLASLLIHCANTVLVYAVSKELLKYFNIPNISFTAYTTAFIWAIHPLNVEPVAWISASKVLLCTLFMLLSFLCFLKAAEKNNIKNYLLAFLWYACACLSKEQGAILPFMFVALFYFGGINKTHKTSLTPTLWFFIPALIIGLIIGYINFNMNSRYPAPVEKYSIWENIILSSYCVRFYLTSTLLPLHLHYFYPFPFSPGKPINILYIVYPVLLIVFLSLLPVFYKYIKNRRFYALNAFSFLVHIGLMLQIFPLTRSTVVADRYMYFPLIFLLLPMVHVLFKTYSREPKVLHYKILFIAMFVLSFSWYSNRLVRNWEKINLAGYVQK